MYWPLKGDSVESHMQGVNPLRKGVHRAAVDMRRRLLVNYTSYSYNYTSWYTVSVLTFT